MITQALYAQGHRLDPSLLGWLTASDARDETQNLHEALERDGYLFLLGALNREKGIEARQCVCERLASEGHPGALTPC